VLVGFFFFLCFFFFFSTTLPHCRMATPQRRRPRGASCAAHHDLVRARIRARRAWESSGRDPGVVCAQQKRGIRGPRFGDRREPAQAGVAAVVADGACDPRRNSGKDGQRGRAAAAGCVDGHRFATVCQVGSYFLYCDVFIFFGVFFGRSLYNHSPFPLLTSPRALSPGPGSSAVAAAPDDARLVALECLLPLLVSRFETLFEPPVRVRFEETLWAVRPKTGGYVDVDPVILIGNACLLLLLLSLVAAAVVVACCCCLSTAPLYAAKTDTRCRNAQHIYPQPAAGHAAALAPDDPLGHPCHLPKCAHGQLHCGHAGRRGHWG
jgi:hypothetical protein